MKNPVGLRRVGAMRRLLIIALVVALHPALEAAAQGREYIVVSGGPALRTWEDLREEQDRHDRWWGNFVRPAKNRMIEIRDNNPGAQITWLVYRSAYARRAAEENRPLVEFVESVRDTYGFTLIWFSTGDDVIRYLNSGRNRAQVKVANFEYFGHSNKFCFMFDYSNHILGASKSWLHEDQLTGIKKNIFTPDAYCKSWGCHTAESMSSAFRRATGVGMVGAIGKTDYSPGEYVIISPGGRWSQ